MKALIYKDLLAVWKYCRNHMIMCAAFLAASVFVEEYSFLQMYPLILMGTLMSALIAYDERDKWDRQVLTMPVTRKQYVSSKYLTGLILQGTVLVLTAAAHVIQLNQTGMFLWDAFWVDMAMLVVLAVAAPSLILPFVFKSGSEKGRMAYLIVVGSIFAVVIGGGMILEKLELMDDLMNLSIGTIMTAVAVLLYPASWALSVYWYEKREF